MDKISLIIPVRNEEKKIEACLKAVFNQTLAPIEVIVVDGHSDDNTVGIAQKFPVIILYEEYHTRAGANQVGVEHAKGDLIAFTDADCIPKGDWLELLQQELTSGTVGVGGAVVNLGGTIWENSINFIMDSYLGSANSVQGRIFKSRRYVKSISGCNSLYRKEAILQAGGFDVTLLTAEDTDLNHKLLKIGQLVYTPDAIVHHNHQRGLKAFAKRMYQYGYGRAKSRIFAPQIIPPLFVPLLLGSLLITGWVFLFFFLFYVILTVTMGIIGAVRMRTIHYLATIPLIYLIEHSAYTLGVWKGITEFLLK